MGFLLGSAFCNNNSLSINNIDNEFSTKNIYPHPDQPEGAETKKAHKFRPGEIFYNEVFSFGYVPASANKKIQSYRGLQHRYLVLPLPTSLLPIILERLLSSITQSLSFCIDNIKLPRRRLGLEMATGQQVTRL